MASGFIQDFDNERSFVVYYINEMEVKWEFIERDPKSNITPHPRNSVPFIISSIFNGSNNLAYLNGNPYH